MSRCTLRYLVTVLLYAGVAIFLIPYFTGHITTGALFLVGGICLAVVCGILRCYLMEGDCTDRSVLEAGPLSSGNSATPHHPAAGGKTPTPSSR